jgi:hypothetical protein
VSGLTTPARATTTLVLALGLLVATGRLAIEAWLVRPEPVSLPADDPTPSTARPGPFLLGIVDGLRAEAADPEAGSAMPFWSLLAAEGTSGVALAGEPTLTACGVRTLLSGRNPDLKTAFANFDAPLARGTLTRMLALRGLRAAHAGDASAWQMTRDVHATEDVLAFPDRGPADQGGTDDLAFPFALARARDPGVGVLTFHVVRPDHAAHRHGATGPEYDAACRASDAQMGEVVRAFRALRPDATILLAADHGVTARGTHGGGEGDARRAPFVLVGPRVARGVRLEIPQSALAPTVAALLGLPVPPLAESPPALDATTLSAGERADALDRYLRARLEVARGLGEGDLAAVIEARRARVFAEGPAVAVVGLAAAYRDLEARAFGAEGRGAAVAALLLAGLGAVALLRTARTDAGLLPPAAVAGMAALALVSAFAAPPLNAGAVVLAACVVFAGRRSPTRSGARMLVLASFVALPVAAAAGLALLGASDAAGDAMDAARGTAIVIGSVGAIVALPLSRAAARRRVADFLRHRPEVLVAVGGALLGALLSLRPILDPYVRTTDLVAVLALLAVAALVLRSRADAPPLARWGTAAAAVLLIGGARVLERVHGDWILTSRGTGPGWMAVAVALSILLVVAGRRAAKTRTDAVPLGLAVAALLAAVTWRALLPETPLVWGATFALSIAALVASGLRGGDDARLVARLLAAMALAVVLHERSDAQVAGFAILAAGAFAASGLPAPATRFGFAGLVLAVLAVRIAAFHALGFTESFSTVDTGAGVIPGLAGSGRAPGEGGVSAEILGNAALLAVKFALPWIVLLAAAARAFARAKDTRLLPAFVADLGVAVVARGAVLVAFLWVWWRSSWWVEAAYPVFALGAADVVLLGLAWAATAGSARSEAAPAGRS